MLEAPASVPSPPRQEPSVAATAPEGPARLVPADPRPSHRRAEPLAAAPVVAAVPTPLTPEAPPAAPSPGERPIVAPPNFSGVPPRSTPPPPAVEAPAGPKEGGVWAVMVGIDDYPGTSGDLRAAAADARKVDAALAAYGVPPHRRLLLLDRQASADNIRRALAWLTARASVDATAVFFYSGHVRQVWGDADGDGEYVDEAIVAADGRMVLDGEVAAILRGLEARSAWIGIAACYGAGFDDALAPGRVLTAAAGENELAYENSALGHSYLVEYMVRRAMLQQKAGGSVQEAFSWARAQIARDYPNRLPVMIDHAGEPVVLRPKISPAPPAPTPAPESPPRQAEPQPAPATPAEPPASPPEDPSDGCTTLLGMSLCSRSRGENAPPVSARTAAWRRAA